ncbi:GNAT family N-acetyltransferase [Microlunatus sp. Gsoil 973]|uniref:GNAT family N-acetyltransferase n=1 Tax=Microlunatus sp. Gsoil 973 TaxID=2672569 RepID=UPI0012B4C642|nr:GNAT family N-acetyltransferase [Microlunatus sp. Gsoil 973]QGN32619.1 GNAT family N-acetyltransferase [Microlunatus sp. Gsoil 973]
MTIPDRQSAGASYTVQPLDATTWGAFADLAERNGGVMGTHRKAYDQDPPRPADWRIICIFTDKRHRRSGVARSALAGAVDLIAQSGGGRIEAVSQAVDGRRSVPYIFSATVELFEENGFDRIRQVGKHSWLLGRVILPA